MLDAGSVVPSVKSDKRDELSQSQETAVTNLQRRWRGLTRRVHVLRKWSWVISNGLEHQEEQRMVELGVFVESIAEELAPGPSLERRSTSGHKSLVSGLQSLAGGFESTEQRLTNGSKPATPKPKHFTLRFPLDEADVLELAASFSRGQLLCRSSVERLLDLQLELLQPLPNVVRYSVPAGQELCIVGDLHGQFEDLMHIFRTHGFPSADRPYLFNGDFVDRGTHSVEVLLTLYAWQQLLPGSVFLNRGNHEERSVNVRNGFEHECAQKYNVDMHERFVATFAWLPLATIVNGKVLVVHGGVDDDLTLADLEAAPRSEYQVSEGLRNNKRLMHPAMMAQQAAQAEREKRIKPITSVLWNDPMEDEGTRPNDVRSIGLFFGPGVAHRFLRRSELGLIVRSHEQVQAGVLWPYGLGRHLVTLFSASNYSGKMQNQGAYALLGSASDAAADTRVALAAAEAAAARQVQGVITREAAARQVQPELDEGRPPTPMWKVTGDAHKQPSVSHTAPSTLSSTSLLSSISTLSSRESGIMMDELSDGPQVDPGEELPDGSFGFAFGRLRFVHFEARQLPETRVQQRIAHRLRALVLAHRAKLELAYQAADCAANGGSPKGVLPVQQWAEITQHVLDIAAPLMQLREQLLGAEAAAASSAGVDYCRYLARHKLVNPRLEPLYRIHEFLLALMYRAEQGTARPEEGMLPMRTVDRICQIMARHFGEEAALCADAATLMGALDALGSEFTSAGEVSIVRLAEQFALEPQDGAERPGLLNLLHRLNRHYIRALGQEAAGTTEAYSSYSSC